MVNLRDYFAGQALAGMFANSTFGTLAKEVHGIEALGKGAYMAADSLLKARELK